MEATEIFFRDIVEASPYPIYLCTGPDMVVSIANKATLKAWGKDESVIGKRFTDALPELIDQSFLKLLKQVYHTGETYSAKNYRADIEIDQELETFYYDFSYQAMRNAQGEITGVICFATDVTKIERAKQEVERNQQILYNIIEQAPVGICLLKGSPLHVQVVNDSYLEIIRRKKSDFGHQPYWSAIPEAAATYEPITAQVLATGQSYHAIEHKVNLFRNDVLETIYVNFVYEPIEDFDGHADTILIVATDVTEQVLARKQLQSLNEQLAAANEEQATANEELVVINEELIQSQESIVQKANALANSEARFRSMVQQAPLAIALFKSTNLYIDLANDTMLETWGKTAEIKGLPLATAMPELIGQPFIEILQDVFTTGETFYGYESLAQLERNGELVEGYFNFICQPVKDETGKIVSVLQVVTEITEQVKARLEVQNAEAKTQLAIEAAKLGSWHIHPVTKALVYNATLAKIFGYEGEQNMTYDQAIAQVVDEYRATIIAAIDSAIADGGDYDITYKQRRFNDGEEIWLRSLGKISTNENGQFSLFSGFVMDITEQKQDEQRKNDFIGMVSHELKTPLTSLNAYIQMLQGKAKKANDQFTIGALDTAARQVKKMTSMINGFLNISRLESGQIILNKTLFSLNELIRSTVEETKLIGQSNDITFTTDCEEDVFADQDKIGNVISNLLSNAIKYSPNNSRIAVNCTKADGMAVVSVKDEGMGIKADDLPKLFERYYRVEHNHTISGFGIGLYLSAEIIERHKGEIWAESELGAGSTFYFTLPL